MGHAVLHLIHKLTYKSLLCSETKWPGETWFIYIWSLKLYACYHRNHDCGHGYQIPQTSITLIFETTSSNVEQMTFARYQTYYISSTEGAIHWRTSMEASGRTNSLMQYPCTTSKIIIIGYRQDTKHATEAAPTSYILIFFQKCWTEDDTCSLPNLLYKFNWRCYSVRSPQLSADFYYRPLLHQLLTTYVIVTFWNITESIQGPSSCS